MKKTILLIMLLITANFFAQDSIVNYLDYKGNIVKKNNAFSLETIVKKDSVWQYTRYYNGGKLKERKNFKTKKRVKQVGVSYSFSVRGNLLEVKTFDSNSELTGKYKSWFDNKQIDSEGMYSNGAKIGVWKYYHFNGLLATKQYYTKGKLMKNVFYDETGQKIDADLIEYKAPSFNGGGLQKFWERIKDIHNRISFQINGVIVLNFDIYIDGNIKNVQSTTKIPKNLSRRLKSYFENIKGWSPAIDMNRRVPYNLTYNLDFRVRFEER